MIFHVYKFAANKKGQLISEYAKDIELTSFDVNKVAKLLVKEGLLETTKNVKVTKDALEKETLMIEVDDTATELPLLNLVQKK